MPQSNVYRRRQLIAVARRGEASIEQAILPVLQARFKGLSRELRQGNLRKTLKKFDGDYEKARRRKVPDDRRSWSSFFRETLRNSITEAGWQALDVEQKFFGSYGYEPLRIDRAEVFQNYLERSDTRITNIGIDTEKAVQDVISEWFNTEESLPDLIERLMQFFDEKRAKLIATTEMAYVASAAAQEMMRHHKIRLWQWDAFQDGITCDTCLDLMEQSKQTPFQYGDPMPPDPSHPNCRCGVYFVGVDIVK